MSKKCISKEPLAQDTNCFEIRHSGYNLRAMYRTACLLSHDCRPNTRHTFGEKHDINLFATRNIGGKSIIQTVSLMK